MAVHQMSPGCLLKVFSFVHAYFTQHDYTVVCTLTLTSRPVRLVGLTTHSAEMQVVPIFLIISSFPTLVCLPFRCIREHRKHIQVQTKITSRRPLSKTGGLSPSAPSDNSVIAIKRKPDCRNELIAPGGFSCNIISQA